MANNFWTPDKQARLAALWKEGKTARKIAVVLRTTRNAVIGKARRMKLEPRTGAYFIAEIKQIRAKPAPGKAQVKPPELKQAEKKKVYPIINIMDLRAGQCRYPIGHPGEKGFTFCAAKTNRRGVYCEEHQTICYTPKTEKVDKKPTRS